MKGEIVKRPEEYDGWDLEHQRLWEARRQTKELSKIANRVGWMVFFFIVVPLLLGFCSVMGVMGGL